MVLESVILYWGEASALTNLEPHLKKEKNYKNDPWPTKNKG